MPTINQKSKLFMKPMEWVALTAAVTTGVLLGTVVAKQVSKLLKME